MLLVPPSNAGVCVTLDRIKSPCVEERGRWEGPRAQTVLRAHGIPLPVCARGQRACCLLLGTWGLFITQCPLNKCGIGSMVHFPPSPAPLPLQVYTHTLKWLPRGDRGAVLGVPSVQVQAGPLASCGSCWGAQPHTSPVFSPAQILFPFRKARTESRQESPLFLGTDRKDGQG